MRRELGGYYPEDDLFKQQYFRHLFLSLKKEEMRKKALNNQKAIARSGGN